MCPRVKIARDFLLRPSMHTRSVAFDLPVPWTNGRFESSEFGYVNFLVGENGSGKSRFAEQLRAHLGNARLLGTDRLAGMEHTAGLRSLFGDHLASGLSKGHFAHFKSARETAPA